MKNDLLKDSIYKGNRQNTTEVILRNILNGLSALRHSEEQDDSGSGSSSKIKVLSINDSANLRIHAKEKGEKNKENISNNKKIKEEKYTFCKELLNKVQSNPGSLSDAEKDFVKKMMTLIIDGGDTETQPRRRRRTKKVPAPLLPPPAPAPAAAAPALPVQESGKKRSRARRVSKRKK